ncbi:restriction endonuclease subunit S [Bacteroides thetaiotaomicron]|uniref:restriction endonuclease subunit S n=1 Tax=Bacteroides thetaiotaomicron TaxID=818 RepID=UPI00376F934C
MGNVPNLRFPEFTGEWKKCKLKDVCTFYSGGTPSSSNKDYYNGDIPFIRSGELHSDKTELFISSKGLKNSSAKMVSKGDLLLALYGATSGDIAISQIEGAINQAILCIKTDQSKGFIEATWCKHVKRILQTYLQGGQGNLSADIVKNIAFYFAPLKEQEKLTQLMKLLDERIATQNKIIEKLQSLIKGLNDDILNDIEGELVCFADLGEAYGGLSGKSGDDFGCGTPFITYLNVYQNTYISENDYELVQIAPDEKQNSVQYGDALFTLSSETPEEVGMGAVYLGNSQKLYLNSFCFGVHFHANRVLPQYIAHFISSTSFRKAIYPLAQGSTRFNLQKKDFMKMKFVLPSLEEQERIATALDALHNHLANEKLLTEQYLLLKQYLLQQMFI